MPTLPQAPEYVLARKLIDYLSADPLIAGMMLSDPYDTADQAQHIQAAARMADAVIVVTPQDIDAAWLDVATGLMQPRLVVGILTMAQVGETTAAERLARITAYIVSLLMAWHPEGRGIPYADPVIEGVTPLDTARYAEYVDMIGVGISVRHKVRYNALANL